MTFPSDDAIYPEPYQYIISFEHKDYKEANISYSILRLGDVNENNILLSPQAWLRLHVKNVYRADSSDQAWIYFTPVFVGYGANVDTILYQSMRPDTTDSFYHKIVKNGHAHEGHTDLYFYSGDTLDYQFFY